MACKRCNDYKKIRGYGGMDIECPECGPKAKSVKLAEAVAKEPEPKKVTVKKTKPKVKPKTKKAEA